LNPIFILIRIGKIGDWVGAASFMIAKAMVSVPVFLSNSRTGLKKPL
jgi:hypothetical protein